MNNEIEARPFEEYKEMIQNMSKEKMIEGLYDLSKDCIQKDKEIERLNNIINETRRILGEYRHFSTPTEEQNSENEEIVDKAYIKLHSNLQYLKGDSSNE